MITIVRSLSILILQGHSLKHRVMTFEHVPEMAFQSSFYKDTLWNMGASIPSNGALSFNPHFTRTLSETWTIPAFSCFQMWLSILILQGHSLKLPSLPLPLPLQYLSILILQGHSLKPVVIRIMPEKKNLSILILQGHSLKRVFLLTVVGRLNLSILILQGHSLKPMQLYRSPWTDQLSILILQGHSLKPNRRGALCKEELCFQSSFYKDTLWNTYAISLMK